ncbi:DNA repair protein RecN [Nostoc sp. HG1]|nr:DNA repair protein RecN [Nostoc sp. HG1]
MIEELSIRGLGVIGSAVLPFGPGLTVVTGETGAGKTMVVTALGLLLGARADAGVVRSPGATAVVEGRWSVDAHGAVAERVLDAGGDLDDGELILVRSISSEGRSRAIVGGRSTPVGVLAEIGGQLVVVHGQSDQMRLRSSVAQREALDRFAGAELEPVAGPYREVFTRLNEAAEELALLHDDRDRRAREADGLRVAIAEIEDVAPVDGEDDELAVQAERLANLEDLRQAAAGAHESMSSEELGEPHDVIGLLDAARRQLDRVAPHDPALAPIVESLREASILAVDVSGMLASYLGDLDADAARELEVVQQRRAALSTLTRKYGPTVGEVLAYRESGSVRLLELDQDSDRIDELEREVERARERAKELAAQLSEVRTRRAGELSARVTAELNALAMGNSTVTIDVTKRDELTAFGVDQVAFLLEPHAGAEPRPLSRGASGGELSRVMLAIEVVIAAVDPVPTFIFDEVDAGVGGAAAIEVGRRLAMLARTSQVIVVTHLAQVAAFADHHLRVAKDSSGEITASSVDVLDGDERTAEMARLLSGMPDSDSALAHARELVASARSSVA